MQLILVNNCPYSVWQGILGSSGHPSPQNGRFHLGVGEEAVFDVTYGWSGRFDEQRQGVLRLWRLRWPAPLQGVEGANSANSGGNDICSAKSPHHLDGFKIPISMSPIAGGIGCGVAG